MKLRILFLIVVSCPLSVFSLPNTEGGLPDISEYWVFPEDPWITPNGSEHMNILMLPVNGDFPFWSRIPDNSINIGFSSYESTQIMLWRILDHLIEDKSILEEMSRTVNQMIPGQQTEKLVSFLFQFYFSGD